MEQQEVYQLIRRVAELADLGLNDLRSVYPARGLDPLVSSNDLIRHVKACGYTRGQIIEAIVIREFHL